MSHEGTVSTVCGTVFGWEADGYAAIVLLKTDLEMVSVRLCNPGLKSLALDKIICLSGVWKYNKKKVLVLVAHKWGYR